MNRLLGKPRPACSAASVYSNPCAKTALKPREPKSLSASAKSEGAVVCTNAVSAPSLAFIDCKPSKAAAFHPASLTGPGVSSATLNEFEAFVVGDERCLQPKRAANSSSIRVNLGSEGFIT